MYIFHWSRPTFTKGLPPLPFQEPLWLGKKNCTIVVTLDDAADLSWNVVIVCRHLFLAGGAITTTRLSSCRHPRARFFIITAAFVIAVRPAMVDGVHLATQPSLTVVRTNFSVVTNFSVMLTLVASRRWFSPGSSDGTLAA